MSVNVVAYYQVRTLKQGRSLDPSEPQLDGSAEDECR